MTVTLTLSDDQPHERAGQNVAQIYERLREAIITGELAPGEIKTQVAISDEVGVGRTPVREALRLLQSEGLVTGEPNRRVRIAPLTGSDVEELYVLRIPMEINAARLTVPNLSFSDIAELEGYMAQMAHYGNGRDWIGLRVPHRGFHAKLVGRAGPRIVKLIGTLADHAERYRLSKLAQPVEPTIEQWAVRKDEHREIADAAAEHDAELTAELLAHHYAKTAAYVLSNIAPSQTPTRLRTVLEHTMPSAVASLDGPLRPA